MKIHRSLLLISFIAISGGSSIHAGETATAASPEENLVPVVLDESSEWNYTFRPYLWAPSLQGNVGAQGVVVPVDFSFGDILDNLDFAFALYTDINRGKWTLATDFQYVKLSSGADDFPFPLFSAVGVEVEQLISSAILFYRVLEWERGFLEIGAGARLIGLKNTVNISVDAEGVADFSEAASAKITSSIAAEVRKAVGNARRSIMAPSPPDPSLPPIARPLANGVSADVINNIDPEPSGELLRAATKGLNNPIRDELKKRIVKKIVQAGPVRDQIKKVIKAQVAEQIATVRNGVQSRVTAKARSAREKAEAKLTREIDKAVTSVIPEKVEGDAWWVDPVIAARARHNFTQKFYGLVYGDIGGFGVSSDLTWQAGGGFGWQAKDWLAFEVLYRHLSIDYQRSVTFDAELSGLFLGAAISF
ncbi:MAG: hypothetical protein L3J39_08775 [Verrucomicrobiales bacterium]|nr:hypothetical protein [Verrucomicrobiales bacterium]